MKDLQDCTREELIAFVRSYPRELERDVNAICEPPLVTFNDFTLGDWPESVVASFNMCMPAAPNAPEGSPYREELPEGRYKIARGK